MKTEVATVSEVERRVTVELDAALVDGTIDRAYKKLSKKVRLPGFRPGKAPLSILQKHFKAQIEEEVISELVQQTFPEAMEQQNIKPVSMPKVENGVLEKGKEFSYTVAVEIKPAIDVQGYTGLKIERISPVATDDDVAEELERYRTSYAEMREITGRAARMDDNVTFDMEGFIGDEPYLGGKKTDYFLELGRNMLLPGFDEQIVGLNPGETKKFDLAIASDYADTQVAGTTIAFTVDLKTIKEKIKPELNDDFAREVGDYQSLDALKDTVRSAIADRKKKHSENNVREQIFAALIEKNPFTVPQGMVEMQAQNMLRDVQRMFQQQGLDINALGQSPEQLLEHYRTSAERQVRSALLLDALAEKEGLKAEDDDYEKQYAELAVMYNETVETLKTKISKDRIEPQVMERKVIDFILSAAEITDK
ncbi:MAG: trigger factor [Deltaproteobacteria bacterium]|nr:trigger factor [Deltaproteobacteria bacterium]